MDNSQSQASKYFQIDSKINNLDSKVDENFQSLDKKYNALKEQISKMTKIYEEDKLARESNKKEFSEDLKLLETKYKSLILEERQVNINFRNFLSFIIIPKFWIYLNFKQSRSHTESVFNKLEIEINKLEKESKSETEMIKSQLLSLKTLTEVKY